MDVNDVTCKYLMFKELIDSDTRGLLCSNQIYRVLRRFVGVITICNYFEARMTLGQIGKNIRLMESCYELRCSTSRWDSLCRVMLF